MCKPTSICPMLTAPLHMHAGVPSAFCPRVFCDVIGAPLACIQGSQSWRGAKAPCGPGARGQKLQSQHSEIAQRGISWASQKVPKESISVAPAQFHYGALSWFSPSLLHSPCSLTVMECCHIRRPFSGFLGGPVVKNPPANAGDTGLSPGPGKSHVLQNN